MNFNFILSCFGLFSIISLIQGVTWYIRSQININHCYLPEIILYLISQNICSLI